MGNTDLVRITDSTAVSNNNELSNMLIQLKDKCIPLIPESMSFGVRPELKVTLTVISVDTELNNSRSNKDIYSTENGQYALHLSKLQEIAQSSDMKITDSRAIDRAVDEEGKVVMIQHQIKWTRKMIDGSTIEGVTTGKYDYYRDKDKFDKAAQIKGRRSHAEALAEGNALSRAINKCIAKLPGSFTLKELEKPFVAYRVVEDPNALLATLPPEAQARVREKYVMKKLGIVDDIFPNANPMPQLQKPEENKQLPPAPKAEDEPDAMNELPKSGLTPEEENHANAETFRGSSQKERTTVILELIKETNFKDPAGEEFTEERIAKNPLNTQIKFIEKLLNDKTAKGVTPLC